MIVLLRCLCAVLICAAIAPSASAHALEPGYMDLRQVSPDSWQVFWRKPDVKGQPMEIDVSLPENCSPREAPAPNFDGAAWVSAWISICKDGLAGHDIASPGLERQRTDVLVRVQTLEGEAQTFRLTPNSPSITIPETPGTWSVFKSYAMLGFEHILEGWDHLLFVFALLVLIRDRWRLVGAITAFTVAHSITLALAALGHVSVPGPPVEAVIALSIVFLAIEILKHRDGTLRLSEQYPWMVSFSFGLLHGLGFAGALTEIGLPGGDIPAALLAFNVGVELGQLAFVAGVLMVWTVVSMAIPRVVSALRSPAQPLLGYAIGSMATFWLVERVLAF